MTIDHRLSTALADRYRIERELGQGGMATVYLAEDLKHHRNVAVKVLRSELAATLGADRFNREIQVAAQLQHPHILPLLDSGEASGFFYYVMPYVEGESLRDRLNRQGELPVHDAVKLLAEVADALAAAHAKGVVHRDIKPDNIMLSGRHALVMDFGVAKAVTEATGAHTLTSVGMALGTPAYMAPEQATADPHIDGRVDIYAVGILAYEMLTGHTPFPGLNPQQTLAAHVTQAPIPLVTQRPGLSPALEAAVMKCLAKRPADRFQTADDLVGALEPLATPSGGTTPTHTRPIAAVASGAGKPTRMILGVGLALLAAVALLLWKPWSVAGGRALDNHLVAVLPFRVAGADPSVQYLRQGMLDLLQAKLTGEGGPRAADTRSVLAAVRDAGGSDTQDLPEDAVAGVARKLGAGRVLQGSIVGPPDHLVISATLLDMPGGGTMAQTSVTGPKDSLFLLIDRLTAQLLALGAGTSSAQLSSLTTANLDALRAYLDGVAAYRRGAYGTSTPLFSHAAELDSTFALALSLLIESDGWHPATGDMARIRRLAWQYRGRLNPQDQLFLSLRLGSRFPRSTPWHERIADDEKAVQLMPESAEAWYRLGDDLYHDGRLAEIPEPELRARQAFEQAFQRDALFGGPIDHLARLSYVAGDTAAQRLWFNRMIALDSTSDNLPGARWDMLRTARDAQGIDAYIAGLGQSPWDLVTGVLFFNPLDSVVLAHQDALMDVMHRLAATKRERTQTAADRARALMNRGRPIEAARWVDTLRSINPDAASLLSVLGAGWFGGGPPDTAQLEPDLLNYWRLNQGDLAAGQRLWEQQRALAAKDTMSTFITRLAPLTQAVLAVKRGDPQAGRLVDVADSLWRGRDGGAAYASLELARLYLTLGRADRALRAVRRRWMPLGEPDPAGLAESFRLEGKAAALAGDKVGATRAYRNYLKLRFDPEPSMIPQRDSVRSELAAVGDLEAKQ